MLAQRFRHAVQESVMSKNLKERESLLHSCMEKIAKLNRLLQECELRSPSTDNDEQKAKLQAELDALSLKMESVKSELQQEVRHLRSKAREEAAREVEKMHRLTACLKGVEAFTGAGAQSSTLQE